MQKRKIITMIVSFVLLCVIIGAIVYFARSKEPETNTHITTIENITDTYLSDVVLDGYIPMIVCNETQMKISISSSQYLIGTYEVNEDGLLTFTLVENASNLESKDVNNIVFEQTESSLIAMENIGTSIEKDAVFTK